MSDFEYQNLQKLFRTVEVILSNQVRRELDKVNYVSDATQRDLLVLDEAKREKHDMEQRVRELESVNEGLCAIVDRFVETCDSAPPVEILQRIGELVEPARSARAKARGEEPPR